MFGRLGLLGNLGYVRSAGEVIDETVRIVARAGVEAKTNATAVVGVSQVALVTASLGTIVGVSNIASVSAAGRAGYRAAPAISNIAGVTASGAAGYTGSVAVSNIAAVGIEHNVSTVDADAQAWIDAMSIAPNSTYEGAYDTFVKELKTGPTHSTNVWTKLDVLHVLAAHDSQAALLNAKAPTGTAATAVNTPAFNAGQGFTFDGSTNYINTNWYAAKSGNNFAQNSGHFGLYHRSIGTAASLRTSGAYPSGSQQFFQMNTSNNVAASINSAALLSDTGNTAGWTLINRTTFNDGRLYYGATEAASYNSSSSALSSAAGKEFFIGALHLTGGASQHGDVEVSVFTAGAGLTANEVVDLNAAIDNLKTAIGF